MCKYRSSTFLRLIVLPHTLMAFLSGCHKWVPVHATIEDAVAASRLESVRITMSDGRILDLKNATVEGDSVIGFAPQRTALPIEQVQTVERRKGDTLGTVGLILGIVAVADFIECVDSDTRC